ncbi:MAG: DUF421 domain-containing protein [Erysipelotrichaceae bacterium]|nr:DUF421 domain-containing protein [Erysipelotrichaceae bacterium]
MNFYSLIIRTLASILTLQLLTKWVGAKTISQCSYYDYIVGITIGDVAASFALEQNTHWIYPVTVMFLYAFSNVFESWLTSKSIKARKILTGVPYILIYHGKIIEDNLKKVHFDINDLSTQCRIQGYFNLSDIDYAVMETTGQLSILPKKQAEPVKIEDTDIEYTENTLHAHVIIDGNIMEKNLHSLGFDVNWLHRRLKEIHAEKPENILLAIASSNNDLIVFNKNETLKHNDYFI